MITPTTRLKATHLLLDMQKHFADGGAPLSMRDVCRLLDMNGSASAQHYVRILEQWGGVKRTYVESRFGSRTLILADPPYEYPPVEYRKA